jgi:hypothetical protein
MLVYLIDKRYQFCGMGLRPNCCENDDWFGKIQIIPAIELPSGSLVIHPNEYVLRTLRKYSSCNADWSSAYCKLGGTMYIKFLMQEKTKQIIYIIALETKFPRLNFEAMDW